MLDNVIEFLKTQDELDPARDLLNTFAKYATIPEEYDQLGKWFMEVKDYHNAVKYAEKALINISGNEGMYACRSNLAKLYNHVNDPKASLRYSTTNLAINPEDNDAKLEQVFSYFLLNEKVKSEAILRELVQDDELPENVLNRVKFNLGTYDLYKGEFQKGLQGFLLEGKKLGIWKTPTLPFKFWEGGIQPGKTIIIMAEGGIGDEIINFRFMKTLVDYGMDPIWYSKRQDLLNIFERMGYKTCTNLKDVPQDSLWTHAMSLPLYLDVQPEELWDGPYLTADPEYIEKWKRILVYKDKADALVGIRWTGNPNYEQDLHREIPLQDVYDILNNHNISIVSLQRDEGADQLYKLNVRTDGCIPLDLQTQLETIEDTLAVMYHLDYVVTSCTSIAHMSAAMGKKTFILVPISAYYVWASTHDTSSIWYGDNVKVLRQVKHKCWEAPLKQLQELLENDGEL